MNDDRLARARRRMRELGIGSLLVGPSPDLRWLVGYDALPLERLTLLVVPAEGEATLVVPELERPLAVACGAGDVANIRAWSETEDPFALVEAAVPPDLAGQPTALQDRLWAGFVLRLQERLAATDWRPGSQVLRDLRIVKTDEEIESLRAVGAAIDEVHAQVPGLLRAGRTEAEVARDIADRILATHDAVNFVIVGSGPNGASPHHEVGPRRLEDGDAVVVDIGGTLDGYCSDETRNYVVGHAPEGYAELHAVLERAQAAAVEAVRPGVTAESIDAAARDVITDAGWGDAFLHRTGHGIGVEEHEAPYIVAGNAEVLRPGMAFSIEPGIYLEGRYGARIEDIVVVTEGGVAPLNHRPHELLTSTGGA